MYHCLPHTLLQNAGISVTKTTDFYWFLHVSTLAMTNFIYINISY